MESRSTTQTIADQLVGYLRAGDFNAVYDNLFHPTKVRHIEPQSPYFAEVTGVEAIKAKDATMMENIAEFKSMRVGDPAVAKDYFTIPYYAAFTLKDGTEVELDEIILYQVEDGKITLEQFFY